MHMNIDNARKSIEKKLQILKGYKIPPFCAALLTDAATAFLSLYMTVRLVMGSNIQHLQIFFILKHCVVFTLVVLGLRFWLYFNQSNHQQKILSSPFFSASEGLWEIVKFGTLANLFYHPLMLLMGKLPPLAPVVNTVLFTGGLVLKHFMFSFRRIKEVQTCSTTPAGSLSAIVVGYNTAIKTWLKEVKEKKYNDTLCYNISGILLLHPLPENASPPAFPVLGPVHNFVSLIQKISLEGHMPDRLIMSQEALSYLPFRQLLCQFNGRGVRSLVCEQATPSQEIRLRPLHFDDLLGKASPDWSSSNTDMVVDMASDNYAAWRNLESILDRISVMITGVEDFVLQRLAQTVAVLYPGQLIVTSPSERPLAELKKTLDALCPDVPCHYILTSITNHDVIQDIVKTYRPRIIFHGERVTCSELITHNLAGAVEKNIFSTRNFAQMFRNAKDCTFVLVNAQTSSVLTRSISSLISQEIIKLNEPNNSDSSRFLVVNGCETWGNLDSQSAFWEYQLSSGIEINLPSADAYSYFLSAQDAARAILQAVLCVMTKPQVSGYSLQLNGNEPNRLQDMIKNLSTMKGYDAEREIVLNYNNATAYPAIMPDFTTSIQETLVPGITIDSSVSLECDNKDMLEKLEGLVAKRQSAKILALLVKTTEAPNQEQQFVPLDRTG